MLSAVNVEGKAVYLISIWNVDFDVEAVTIDTNPCRVSKVGKRKNKSNGLSDLRCGSKGPWYKIVRDISQGPDLVWHVLDKNIVTHAAISQAS